MTEKQNYLDSYEVQQVVLFGAAGSSSVIFSVLFLFFLDSWISPHPGTSIDTISEMMGYVEFFFLTFASYFSASVLIWRLSSLFATWTISWLPIALLGSLLFSLLFSMRIWIESLFRIQHEIPTQVFTPDISAVMIGVLVLVCFALSSIGCAIMSAFLKHRKGSEKALVI